jgi:hypothetical protein
VANDKNFKVKNGIDSGGVITATVGNSTEWSTAYTYSQVGHLPLTGGTLTGNLAINNGSPELYFGTTGNHYNWRIAAQELVDAGFEIAVGSQDTDYSNDTYVNKFVVKASGNVGIGRAPDTVYSGSLQLALGNGSQLSTSTAGNPSLTITDNSYLNASGNHVYKTTNPSTRLEQYNGTLTFSNAASGTAGATISYAERLRIDSSGNVGIGTNSPGSYAADANNLVIYSAAETGMTIVSGTASTGDIYFSDGTSAQNRGYFQYHHADDSMRFGIAATERMRIDASGNVGIGQTAFGVNGKLQVTGGIGLTGNSEIRQSTNADGSTLRFLGTQLVISNSNGNGYSYSGGGLVASVAPASGAIMIDAGAVNTSGHRLKVINGGDGIQGSLQYLSGTTSRFHVDSSSGNVGIGTNSPSAKLELNVPTGNGLLINSADVATIKMKNTGGGVTNWGFATTNLAAGDFGIYASNSVGGDPITAGAAKLYFTSTGAATFSSTISSGAITSNGNLTVKGSSGFNASGETASIYLGDTASEIRATYDGGTKFFVNGTDRMEIEGGSGNLNLKTGNFEINGTTVIDNNRRILAADGAQNVPYITFAADADTGLYRPASDVLGISTAGIERVRVDASGRVGIKTTPSAWGTDYGVLDLNTGGSIYGTTSGVSTASNLYFTGAAWLAKNTGLGTLYAQHTGKHFWYSSASVSAGSSASLAQKMELDSSGVLDAVGGYKVNGTTVIDASRNLTNIGTASIAGTSYFTGGSSAVPALHIRSGGNSWSEGMAIHPASDNSYALTFYRTKTLFTDQTDTWAIGNLGQSGAINHFAVLRKGLTGSIGARSDSPFDISPSGIFRFGFNPTVGSNSIWHAGNDGSGSGLDADLLDGVQGSSFLRSDATDTATGVMTFSNTVNLQGSVVFSNPIENFNTFTANKIHHSIETNMLAGKGSKLKVTIDGVESTAAAYGLTNQNFEEWNVISATAGSAPKVININLVTNGLYASSGITYSAGFVVLNFYSTPFPSGWSARVKNKDGVWTAMTMTKIGTTLRGTIPISNYITDLEFTLESGTTGPYVTGTVVWGLCEVAYYGSRMALYQGASVTSIGGYIDGNLTFGKTSGTPFIVNSTSVVTNLNADLLDGQQGTYYLDYNNFVNVPASSVGSYLPLSGGTITGSLTVNSKTTAHQLQIDRNAPNAALWFQEGDLDFNHVLWNDYYGAPNARGASGSGFDGIKWNTYRGIHLKGGVSGAYNLIVAENSSGSNNDHTVKLYASNEQRLQTTTEGVDVEGNITATRFRSANGTIAPLSSSYTFSNVFTSEDSASRVAYFDGNGANASVWWGNGANAHAALDSSDGLLDVWVNPLNGSWYNIADFSTSGLAITTGGLSVGGTEVIDSSRNLTNITSIDLPNANNWSYIKNNTPSGGLRFGTKNAAGTYSDQIEISATGDYVKLNRNTTVTGTITATDGNSTNWNTAYGWGDHASAGYITSASGYLPLAGGTMTGPLNFGDGVYAQFGDSQDLKIGHSGATSYIQDVGTGDLSISTNGASINLRGGNDNNDMAVFTSNGGVQLNYAGAARFSAGQNANTSNVALNVTGIVTATDGNSTNWNTAYGWGDHASADYAPASHNHQSLGGFSGLTEYTILDGPGNGPVWKVRWDGATANRYWDLGFKDGYGTFYSGLKNYNNTTLTWITNTIWHAGNDGSGSTLDADLLDGYEASTGTSPYTAAIRDGSGNLPGNISTATTLETARTINGVSFNGSANITVEPYIEDDEGTDATRLLVFTDNTTAGFKRLNEDSGLTYNPFNDLLRSNSINAFNFYVGTAHQERRI